MELHLAKQHVFICDTLDYNEILVEDFCKNISVALLSWAVIKFPPSLFGAGYNGSSSIFSNVRQNEVS